MIEPILVAAIGIIRADATFVDLWAGVQPHSGEKAPYLFPSEAPDGWPKPYVIYSIEDNEATKFGAVRWPAKEFYLTFVCHDYRPSSKRAYRMAERIGHLLAMEALTCDPALATAVRIYEDETPVMVPSDKKNDVAWKLTLPVRGYDAKAAQMKFDRWNPFA